jgi:hypothetical protein
MCRITTTLVPDSVIIHANAGQPIGDATSCPFTNLILYSIYLLQTHGPCIFADPFLTRLD